METKNTTRRNITKSTQKAQQCGWCNDCRSIYSLFSLKNHEWINSIIWVIFPIMVINLHHICGFLEWCTFDKKLMQGYKSYQWSSWKGLASHKSKKSIPTQVKDRDMHNSKKQTLWRHKSKTQCWISYKSNLTPILILHKSNLIWLTNFNLVQVKILYGLPILILYKSKFNLADQF